MMNFNNVFVSSQRNISLQEILFNGGIEQSVAPAVGVAGSFQHPKQEPNDGEPNRHRRMNRRPE
jgi:hypothetical protein